ncbi:hypothetical protein [Ancylobacter polymorphus]|uniref:Uncharacterized protein n=1 Tax=Ancylobacter polymorphus TaxID=223390 RepID=A0ABU0B6C7_9HYPH|nr:hypothetical protein [Ancylobacter polymorphus]MDQ0301381.1 hypothetical protein [Ancylobacter polymorphus]
MSTFDSDAALSVCGVPGRLTHRTTKPGPAPGLWFRQRWISEARSVNGYGCPASMRVEMRFDDDPSNGHNTFAITAEVWADSRRRRDDMLAGGCMHEEIARVFPELAHLIRWHLVSTDGPMHYVANTVYFAGDRDHNGLRAGERRALVNGKTKLPVWELVAVTSGPHGEGVKISDTATGREYIGAETVPLFILTKDHDGEHPPATPRLEWRRRFRVGEGKARELDKARNAAVWPDATDEELSREPADLRAALVARLPALLQAFRADMEAIGFLWSPEDFRAAEDGEG